MLIYLLSLPASAIKAAVQPHTFTLRMPFVQFTFLKANKKRTPCGVLLLFGRGRALGIMYMHGIWDTLDRIKGIK